MNKVRDLITVEIDRLKALKQSVKGQAEQTKALLETQNATLDSITKDIQGCRDAFRMLGGSGDI